MNETSIDYWPGSVAIGAGDASPADEALVASSKSPVSGGSVWNQSWKNTLPSTVW